MIFLIRIYQLIIPISVRDVLRELKNRFKKNLQILVLLALNVGYSPLAFCLRMFGFIFPNFQYLNRIGHLACEPDMFLKEAYLDGRSYRYPVILMKTIPANKSLLRDWEKYFLVINNKFLSAVLNPLLRHPLTRYETKKYVVATDQTAQAFSIHSKWGDRDPLLRVSSSAEKRGKIVLRNLGVEAGRWYVCMHGRSPHYSPNDEHYNNFRNFNFDDFKLAIKWIHDHGGVCIRMGDSKMDPIKDVIGLIDYAVSEFKEDWFDIYLAATCRFFVGSASGLYGVASVFGRPVAAVNMAPLSMTLPLRKGDIGIPKLYKDKKTDRILTFREIISIGAANYRFSNEFEAAGIQLESNSPEDILDLVIEQYNRNNGFLVESKSDIYLQNAFISLFKDGHYCFKSAANVGYSFLRKYKDLLE